MPIIAGIMPITNFEQIKRFTSMCGATIPPALHEQLEARNAEGDEAVTELGVAYATLQCADLLARGAPGIHFYTLNKSPATRAILSALKAARPWRAGARQRSGSCSSGVLTRSTRPVRSRWVRKHSMIVSAQPIIDGSNSGEHQRYQLVGGGLACPRRRARSSSSLAWISARFASMCARDVAEWTAVPG